MIYGISQEHQREVLRKKAVELAERLERGDQMCRNNPDDKRLEEFWLDLLKQYKDCCHQYWNAGGAVGSV